MSVMMCDIEEMFTLSSRSIESTLFHVDGSNGEFETATYHEHSQFLSETQNMRSEFPLSGVLRLSVSSRTISNISYKNMPIFLLKLRVKSVYCWRSTDVFSKYNNCMLLKFDGIQSKRSQWRLDDL